MPDAGGTAGACRNEWFRSFAFLSEGWSDCSYCCPELAVTYCLSFQTFQESNLPFKCKVEKIAFKTINKTGLSALVNLLFGASK